MPHPVIRLVLINIVAALALVPVQTASAQTRFPAALSSTDFEALLTDGGVPDAQRAAAMAEYDRYQLATSAMITGAMERFIKSAPDGERLMMAGNDSRTVEQVREQVREYRSILAQWEALEGALLDSLSGLGADAARLDRVRHAREVKRIGQMLGGGFMLASSRPADLWSIASKATAPLTPEQQRRANAVLAAREREYVEAVRAVRSAVLDEPERVFEARAKAAAEHPLPTAEEAQRLLEDSMKAAQAEAEKPGSTEESVQEAAAQTGSLNDRYTAHFRALAQAQREARTATQEAKARALKLGGTILLEAFAEAPQPVACRAWQSFMRSASVSAAIDDGGAISIVEGAVKKAPLTPEQQQAIAAAFAAWQQSVAATAGQAAPGVEMWFGGDDHEFESAMSKRRDEAKERSGALRTAVRAALGIADAPERTEVVVDEPDGGAAGAGPAGAPGETRVARVFVAVAGQPADGADAAAGPIAIGEDAVFTINAGDLEIQGDGFMFGPQRSGVAPISRSDLDELAGTCGAGDAVRPLIQQLHEDYMSVARPVKESLDATAPAGLPGLPGMHQAPEQLGARADAVRRAVDAMKAADAALFDDLAAVLDAACVRQQAQYRERALVRRATKEFGDAPEFGAFGAEAGAFVDPEEAIRQAAADQVIDAAQASELRAWVEANGHGPLLAALGTRLDVNLTKGREAQELEARLWASASDGAQDGAQVSVAFDGETSRAIEAAHSALRDAAKATQAVSAKVCSELPALLPEDKRPAFVRTIESIQFPGTFGDPTALDPYFAKALALDGLDAARAASIRTAFDEYRGEYAALRARIADLREKAIMPSFEELDDDGDHAAFQARVDAAESAKRVLAQAKTDRDELNRRVMRKLKALLSDEQAKAIGDLPKQGGRRGPGAFQMSGAQIMVP